MCLAGPRALLRRSRRPALTAGCVVLLAAAVAAHHGAAELTGGHDHDAGALVAMCLGLAVSGAAAVALARRPRLGRLVAAPAATIAAPVSRPAPRPRPMSRAGPAFLCVRRR